MGKQIKNEHNIDASNSTNCKSCWSMTGFWGGIILGVLGIFSYYIKESPSAFYESSKIFLLFILLGCGLLGALVGEKIMEKILSWFSWFG